jgi:hypothetical protein
MPDRPQLITEPLAQSRRIEVRIAVVRIDAKDVLLVHADRLSRTTQIFEGDAQIEPRRRQTRFRRNRGFVVFHRGFELTAGMQESTEIHVSASVTRT